MCDGWTLLSSCGGHIGPWGAPRTAVQTIAIRQWQPVCTAATCWAMIFLRRFKQPGCVKNCCVGCFARVLRAAGSADRHHLHPWLGSVSLVMTTLSADAPSRTCILRYWPLLGCTASAARTSSKASSKRPSAASALARAARWGGVSSLSITRSNHCSGVQQ